MDSSNPYHSPPPEAAAARRRTKWRILLVAPLIIGGAIALLTSPLLIWIAIQPTHRSQFGLGLRLLGALLFAASGGLWIASGICGWRGRWLLALVGFGLGILAYLAAVPLSPGE